MIKDNPIAGVTMHALSVYKEELQNEWAAVLDYWMKYTVDKEHGGFYGSVNNDNIADPAAPKGIVMNSRILWAFSAAAIRLKKQIYLDIAHRAFDYIVDHFYDTEFGAVYWSVDSKGKMLDGKKQIYGIAFCIYGMSEYYRATKKEYALNLCKKLFYYIEQFSLDKINGGYLEAFTRDWKLINDQRLSEKDENAKKTMNTHLHLIEAYSNLYRIWPDHQLGRSIAGLLDIFDRYIINKDSFHLNLFMDEEWNLRSSLVSFGHDIEAAWLLLECANVLRNGGQIEKYKQLSIALADAAAQGLDKDGGLWYEYEPAAQDWIKEKHSWPQAEAMVGFFNAYQVSQNKEYLQRSLNSWVFVKKNILDRNGGEWFWGIKEDSTVMQEDKAGFWKCPYHNSRACMELIGRIDQILK